MSGRDRSERTIGLSERAATADSVVAVPATAAAAARGATAVPAAPAGPDAATAVPAKRDRQSSARGWPATSVPPASPPPPTPRRTRAPRRDPGGLVAGLVIAGIGLFFLAGQLEPDIGRFVTLFIGLALLAVFVVQREYGFLVPGSILTGVGIGIVLDSAASGEAESGVMMLASPAASSASGCSARSTGCPRTTGGRSSRAAS